jgi:Stf0 sulphotransferase
MQQRRPHSLGELADDAEGRPSNSPMSRQARELCSQRPTGPPFPSVRSPDEMQVVLRKFGWGATGRLVRVANVTHPGFDSYLICATPRTGSTLLCGLLKSSGVAGCPASYFNRRGLHDYADDWRIARPRDGRIDEA